MLQGLRLKKRQMAKRLWKWCKTAPPDMDGYEATRQIRKMDREDAETIPIFAVSANHLDEDVKKSLDSGMNGHIAKPVDFDSIEKVLKKVFAEQGDS